MSQPRAPLSLASTPHIPRALPTPSWGLTTSQRSRINRQVIAPRRCNLGAHSRFVRPADRKLKCQRPQNCVAKQSLAACLPSRVALQAEAWNKEPSRSNPSTGRVHTCVVRKTVMDLSPYVLLAAATVGKSVRQCQRDEQCICLPDCRSKCSRIYCQQWTRSKWKNRTSPHVSSRLRSCADPFR